MFWTGPIEPSALCERYTVAIAWTGGTKRPNVRVVAPKLQDRADKKVPHRFPDGSLCLHLYEEWRPEMLISQSIIPWASEWLAFYEVWRATGEWLGGGHEPDPKL
jgi:hypothetical protein